MNRINACFTLLGIIGLTLAVVVCLFCCPVSAKLIPIDYGVDNLMTQETTSTSFDGSYQTGDAHLGIKIYDVEKWTGIKSTVYGIGPFSGSSALRNVGVISSSVDCNFLIGTDVIGSGSIHITTHNWGVPSSGWCSATITILYEDIDFTGYTGTQNIVCDYELTDFNFKVYKGRQTVTFTNPDSAPVLYSDFSSYKYIDITGQRGVTYYDYSLHQAIEYDENTDGSIYLYYYRLGQANLVNITGNSGYILYEATEETDISFDTLYDIPVVITVYNPLPDGDPTEWVYTIPESIVSTADPAEFTSYIYDAQTGHLISGASTTKTYDAASTSTSDPSGVVHDVVYWEDTTWASFTASATGYYNSTVEFNYTATPLILPDLLYAAPGSNNIQSFHLIPTTAPSPSSYALTFQIQQEISPNSGIFSRSVDATVTCDGIQHLTGPSGSTWYNVTAGSHAYTVSKNGFETVQGSVTVSTENLMETAYLHLSQSEPTPIGNETSGEVGDEDMHEAVAEAYAEFAAFIPEAVMIGCVLFLLAMFKKF